MIRIATDSKYLDKDSIIFDNSDSFVEACVTAKDFNDLDIYALSKVDDAILEDRSTDLIKTKFGLTTISCLSTGCKTVLMYLYYMRHKSEYADNIVIDINECGWNAMDTLFDCADKLGDSSTVFYLCHQNEIDNCKNRDYLINNKKHVSNLLYM